MAHEITTRRLVERRTRGVFGWFFLVVFWGWNLLMLYAIVKGVGDTPSDGLGSQAERDAHAAGVGLAVMVWLVFWAFGSVVFGALAYFTRGRREIIEYVERG